jgi:hypothetical protein
MADGLNSQLNSTMSSDKSSIVVLSNSLESTTDIASSSHNCSSTITASSLNLPNRHQSHDLNNSTHINCIFEQPGSSRDTSHNHQSGSRSQPMDGGVRSLNDTADDDDYDHYDDYNDVAHHSVVTSIDNNNNNNEDDDGVSVLNTISHERDVFGLENQVQLLSRRLTEYKRENTDLKEQYEHLTEKLEKLVDSSQPVVTEDHSAKQRQPRKSWVILC